MTIKTSDSRLKTQDAKGFSLTEVLIAVGLIAVGMLFIAGAFPVSIHFATVATERTIAPTVADEAFAKCRLYLQDINPNSLNFNSHKILVGLPPNEFTYPSTPTTQPYSKQYWWSVIFRRINLTDIQTTVFVNRKVGVASQYIVGSDPNAPGIFDSNRPDAIVVGISGTTGGYDLTITDVTQKNYINDGYTIVDDATGQIYRVLERYPANDMVLRLDKPWRPDLPPSQLITGSVWVASSPVSSSRYPCIGIYQRVIRF
jgi:prepilin-type N-terminal cleavage/methylation domain-containing protein